MLARLGIAQLSSQSAGAQIAALLCALLLAWGCTDEETQRGQFRVSFVCVADREQADALSLTVLRGGCQGTEIVYGARLKKGEKAPPLPVLDAGLYGFSAEASKASQEVASGCTTLRLPTREGVSIALSSQSCKASVSGMDAGPDENNDGALGDAGDNLAPDSALPDAGTCQGLHCDDHNPCTEYVCDDDGKCSFELLTRAMECDGVACTTGDQCVAGLCAPGAADSTLCEDDNPCNREICVVGVGCSQNNLDGERCDDGLGCTEADVCLHGRCWGTSSCANGGVCDSERKACVTCTKDAQCDDNDPCTRDTCSCADAACEGGTCSRVAVADGTACDDGTSCTSRDRCQGGVCQGQSNRALCDDRNACTEERCDVTRGCVFDAAEGTCDDDRECTSNDRCVAGACAGDVSCGEGAYCDALGRCVQCEVDADCRDATSDACLIDSCVEGRCLRTLREGACDDGVACTVGDVCVEGVCHPGKPEDERCADSDQCTRDVCEPFAGCTHRLAALDCNDGVDCTTNDKCSQGVCRGQSSCGDGQICQLELNVCVTCLSDNDCADGNECSSDRCVNGVCQHSPLTNTQCNDATSCTREDRCVDGACVGTPDHALCPANDCVSGLCVPGTGCTTSYNTSSCNDGKACTVDDTCSQGQCAGVSNCPGGAVCQAGGCLCTGANETLCGDSCANLATSNQHCGECGYACRSGHACVLGACRPTAAPAQCVALRYRGHDYLICDDATQTWNQARTRCRNFGLDLPIIADAAENNQLRIWANGKDRWIGASDKGDNGSNCRRSGQEGLWRWIEPSNGGFATAGLCEHASSSAKVCTVKSGMYANFRADEPNNSGCNSCPIIFGIGGDCSEGEDCGMLYAADGTWNDAKCASSESSDKRYYICESY